MARNKYQAVVQPSSRASQSTWQQWQEMAFVHYQRIYLLKKNRKLLPLLPPHLNINDELRHQEVKVVSLGSELLRWRIYVKRNFAIHSGFSEDWAQDRRIWSSNSQRE
jgi:hypothetical protein